jgi:hypothetical protein
MKSNLLTSNVVQFPIAQPLLWTLLDLPRSLLSDDAGLGRYLDDRLGEPQRTEEMARRSAMGRATLDRCFVLRSWAYNGGEFIPKLTEVIE